MNHTPGPWHIQKYSSGHMLYVNADNAQVAHVLHTETRGLIDTAEKREANARLIAAAPELLTALKAAQAHLEYTGYGDKWERGCARHDGLEEQIQAAIDKAESEYA